MWGAWQRRDGVIYGLLLWHCCWVLKLRKCGEERATLRAISRLGRCGLLNTCLTRSLVAGAMLSDARDVCLHVGFKVPHNSLDLIDGHAWLTRSGVVVINMDRPGADGCEFDENVVLDLYRDN